jgi:hypothetical protein
MPRDCHGKFNPQLIAKYQRRFPELDAKIDLDVRARLGSLKAVCADVWD